MDRLDSNFHNPITILITNPKLFSVQHFNNNLVNKLNERVLWLDRRTKVQINHRNSFD